MNNQPVYLPLKNIAAALMFAVILGPVGLLYSSFWGGFLMVSVALVVFSGAQKLLMLITWIACCIWSVGAAEAYNRKIIATMKSHVKE
jgi:hypothetical protein